MAQTELVTMQLPSGESVDVEVPTGWSDQQVTEYVDGLGLFSQAPQADVPKDTYRPEPSKGEQFLYGMASTPGLVEEAANLIEQKITPKLPERTRDVYEGGDVPMIDEQGNVQMDPRYAAQKVGSVTLPAVTEESIRAQQKQRKADVLAADFPNMQGREASAWVKAGSVTRMLTDMATFPLPFASQVKLGKFAADGGKLMSAEGRALYGSAMLEAGSTVGLFGAADAAIRNLADTGELKPGDVATAGLIAMSGGALVGPVLAAGGGKFMGWLNSRYGGKPVTPEEVGDAAEKAGKVLTPDEMRSLADAVNKAGARAKVEAATVDILHSPKTAMSVTKDGAKTRMLTKEEKKIRKEIRQAFAEDPEMADFLKREASMAVAERERQAAELERLGPTAYRLKQRLEAKQPLPNKVSKAMDEVQAQKIRDRQDAALAELELEASKAELPGNTKQVLEEGAARRQDGYDRPGILGNQEAMRDRKGNLRVAYQVGQKIAEMVASLSPRTAMAMRKVQTETNRNSAAVYRGMPRWLGDKEITKAFNKNREFQRAVGNSDEAAMDRIVPGSAQVYREEVKPVLQSMWRSRQVNGLPVLKDVLHPRAVRDVQGLRNKLGRKERDQWDEIVARWERDHPKQTMNEEDAAGLLGQIMGGRHLPIDRSRRIKEITAGAERFYVNPRAALIDAIARHQEMVAMQQFFKNHLGQEVQLGKILDSDDLKHMLSKAISDNEISGAEATRLAQLIAAWNGPARRSPRAWSRNLHNAISFEALGANPMSTLTQVADQFNNASKFGVRETLRAMWPGKRGDVALTAYDSGVRSLSHDIRTQEGFARAVRWGLRVMGFDQLDHKFSNQGSRLALRARMEQAKADPEKLYKEMTKWFEPESARKLVDDLKEGRVNPDIAALVANDVADVRPQGMLDMPEHYLNNPNGRVAYSLMSWTVNQMNYVRNRGLNEIEAGIRSKDMARVKAGAKVLAHITLLNSLGGMTVGTMKDFIRGEEMTPEREMAYALGGALPLALAGKYVTDKVLAGRGSWTDIMPAASIIDGHLAAVAKFITKGELEPLLEMSGWGRTLKDFLTGTAIISEAEAAYSPEGYSAVPRDAQALAPEPVKAENNLPAGWSPLAEPTAAEYKGMNAASSAEFKPMMTKDGKTQLTVPKDMPAKETLDVSRELIRKREGETNYVYSNAIPDGKGGWKWDKPTAGVGHVLVGDERSKYPMGKPPGEPKKGARWIGPSVDEKDAEAWFSKDGTKAWNEARKQAAELGRKDMVPALASVIFQLGTNWYKDVKLADGTVKKGHKNTWRLLKEGQWLEAAKEAANSQWAKQTPTRVDDFQRAIRSIIE